MNTQYFHQMQGKERYTVAVEVPTVSGFMHLLSKPLLPNLLLVGSAYCNPKDQFTKKTGRELAQERMAPITVKFYNANLEGTDILHFTLMNVSDDGPKFFYFRVNVNSTKPHFLGV